MPVTRGGRKKNGTGSERRCIATGASHPCSKLIRFTIGPDNTVVPDIRANLPGRGIWVLADTDALDKAVAKNLFSRAARQKVVVPEALLVKTESLLARNLVNLLSLARKSGTARAGFEKVKAAVLDDSVALLLQAADGSERQLSKIRPPKGENTLISCLYAHELGLAFGRESVIHAALGAGGLNERIVEEAFRLAGFRKSGAQERAKSSGIMPETESVEDE